MSAFFVMVALSIGHRAHGQINSQGNVNPRSQPNGSNFPVTSSPDDPYMGHFEAARKSRLSQERIDHLRSGSDHLADMCAQLRSNLSEHAVPDEKDRKLMADIEKQLRALRSLMVQ